MTAPTTQGKAIRRERRIIERPRLMKLLDESEARTILLLAPAGYGKTTLARQWAKTLNGAIWVTATPAHRDVATLAEDIARGIDALGGNCRRFIAEYLRAKSNPQRVAKDVALALAEHMDRVRVQWVIIDDYHDLVQAPEADELIAALEREIRARVLIASRQRPSWATPRRVLYGEILEVNRDALAMNPDESTEVLGPRPALTAVVSQAEGWPAVLGLAAKTGGVPPGGEMPAGLYQYFAEELYQSVPEALQRDFLNLALAAELSEESAAAQLGHAASHVIAQAQELGFISLEHHVELHPLVREFLLQKLAEDPTSCEKLVRRAVGIAIERGRWDRAFELIVRFNLRDLIEPVLEASYKPLTRSGRLGTLSAFAADVRLAPTFPPPVVDLVEADVALRDGSFGLARELAKRVRGQLPQQHPLASRASAIIGQSAFIQADLEGAEAAYRLAHERAADDEDEGAALYGWALASIQGEVGDPGWTLSLLAERRHRSPLDLVRYGTAEFARRRFQEGLAAELPLSEPLHAIDQVQDPRARTSFAFTASYALAVKAEYDRALNVARLAESDVETFDLDFVRPHSDWNRALIALGLRRFGAAERALQQVEDKTRDTPLDYHVLNARILRARLALLTGQADVALAYVSPPDAEAAIPSLHGEYWATRGLVLACLDDASGARDAADTARRLTTAVEVRVLASSVFAIVAAKDGGADEALELWETAKELGAWDPVVAALRSSPALANLLAGIDAVRPALADLYERSNDRALARRAGLRARSTRVPEDLLSPRELEVLGLLSRGFRNRDISKALVISESTTKVHIRHIFEKLGVRTRTEAVARLQMFD